MNYLEEVWKEVKSDYKNELINSERCLQAILYMNLRNIIGYNSQIFIEPKINIGEEEVIPDIIICRNKIMTDVIEIKYAPHWFPKLTDLEKLKRISQSYTGKECDLFLYGPNRTTDVKSEKWDEEHLVKYSVTEQTRFIFAAVGQKDTFNEIEKEMTSNNFFLLLGKMDKCSSKSYWSLINSSKEYRLR